MRKLTTKIFLAFALCAFQSNGMEVQEFQNMDDLELIILNADSGIEIAFSLSMINKFWYRKLLNDNIWGDIYYQEKGHKTKGENFTFQKLCKHSLKTLKITVLSNRDTLIRADNITRKDRLNFNIVKLNALGMSLLGYNEGARVFCVNYDCFTRCGEDDGLLRKAHENDILAVLHATSFRTASWLRRKKEDYGMTDQKNGIWTSECDQEGKIDFRKLYCDPIAIDIAVKCSDEQLKDAAHSGMNSLGVAPVVIAEFVARLFILRPDLTAEDIRFIVLKSADKTEFGYGIFNRDAAIEEARKYLPAAKEVPEDGHEQG